MNYGNYPDLSNVKKILVVKMRHHGDVLLTSPVFSELKKRFPDAKIDAYVYKDTAPMLEGHPAIDKFYLYDRAWKKLSPFHKLGKETSFLLEIFSKKYDLVINLTEGDRGAIIAFCSGARIRVGFDAEGKGFWKKNAIYTHIVKNCQTPKHTVERQLDTLRRIGVFPEESKELFFHIPESATARMQEELAKSGIEPGSYILVHPASRWRFKCWPMEKVSNLMQQLSKQGYKLVITSGPDLVEKQMVQQILSAIPDVPVCNLSGSTSLKELGALVQMAKGIVCVDSVPLHMASAFKTPVVVIFGPTSEKNWGPWKHAKSCVVARNLHCRPCLMDGCGGSKRSECLVSLPEEAVMQGLKQIGL